MSRAITDFDSIRDVLKASVGSRVPIILVGGRRIVVEVLAVRGELLIASVGCRPITINIDCICAVCICCETILRFLLRNNRKEHREEEAEEDLGCCFESRRRISRRISRSRNRSRNRSRSRSRSRSRNNSRLSFGNLEGNLF
jgi:hypothetical protein